MAANRISRALWRENSLPQIVDKLAGENGMYKNILFEQFKTFSLELSLSFFHVHC